MGKLWLIEGLPGSGKTTFAEALAKRDAKRTFYSEVDPAHPVDVHDVRWVEGEVTSGHVLERDARGTFVRYESTDEPQGTDVYELPFEQHVDVMLGRWERFVQQARHQDEAYVFECALLQNPFTIGMISQDVPLAFLQAYVEGIVERIAPLDPTVVYVELEDVETAFKDVYAERPEAWQHGFVEYYTKRRYAMRKALSGIDGTIEILKERQRHELDCLNRLSLHHVRVLNDHRNAIEQIASIESGEGHTCRH